MSKDNEQKRFTGTMAAVDDAILAATPAEIAEELRALGIEPGAAATAMRTRIEAAVRARTMGRTSEQREKTIGLANGATYLYAYGDDNGWLVKIGHSANPYKRKQQHETRWAGDVEMTTIGVWIGHQSDENYIKNYFKHLGIKRQDGKDEKFDSRKPKGEELRGWLRMLRQQYFVAHSENDLETLPVVDPAYWLPGQENSERRILSAKQQPDLFAGTSSEAWADIVGPHDEIMDGDFYTSPILTRAARIALGGIDLDPASCRAANSEVQAARIYDIEQNGLAQRWYGRIWLNPPFPWGPWVDKFVTEWQSGRVKSAIILSTTRVLTAQYFSRMCRLSSVMLLTFGRYSFWGPKAHDPDEGHALLYYGPNPERFVEAYREIGFCWKLFGHEADTTR